MRGPVQYRPDIDGLRSVAVVPVVLFHAGVSGFPGGYVGVDVFFVISGYLITSILMRDISDKNLSIIKFYERRARRILPALFVMLAAVLLFGWVLFPPGIFVDTAESAVATVAFSSNIYFWNSLGYFSRGAEYHSLLHTWSLAVEEHFYLIWPIMLVVIARQRRLVCLLLVALIFAVSLAASVVLTPRYPVTSFYLLPTRAWELMTGALLALGAVPAIRGRLAELAALAGIAMIAGAVVLYDVTTPFPGIAAVVPCLGAALVIATGAHTGVGRVLSWAPFVLVGQISYSLYLWHWPPLVFLRVAGGSLEIDPVATAGAIAFACVVAWLSWRFVERPFRDRRRFGRRAIFALSGASAAALVALAMGIYVSGGVPSRFDAQVVAMMREAESEADGRYFCSERMPSDGLCHLGNVDSAPSVLWWGDSHAGAAIAGIDHALVAVDKAGAAAIHYGCVPLIDVRRVVEWENCIRLTSSVLAILESPGSTFDTVLIHARWALMVTGDPLPDEVGDRVDLVSMNGAATLSNARLIEDGLTRLVKRLRAAGLRVVLIGGVPEIGWNVPERMLVQSRFSGAKPMGSPTLEAVKARNVSAERILSKLAGEEGVEFVSLAEAFCRPQCETVRDGHLLYHDDDHLSRYAAERILGPYLRTRLWPVTNPVGPGPRQGEREAQRPLYHPPADRPRTGRAPTPP